MNGWPGEVLAMIFSIQEEQNVCPQAGIIRGTWSSLLKKW